MEPQQWIPRRERPKRRATMSRENGGEKDGESDRGKPDSKAPETAVARPRASASRFSIGNPSRGNIDFGGFVKPRLNPDYDETAPIESRALPYREAGFVRRLLGDTANESNAEFANKQQDLQFKLRALAAAHDYDLKRLVRASELDADNMRYGRELDANLTAISDARRSDQARRMAELGYSQQAIMEEMRQRGQSDEALRKLAVDYAPHLVSTLARFPDDPMAHAALSDVAGQQFSSEQKDKSEANRLRLNLMQRQVDSSDMSGDVLNTPFGSGIMQKTYGTDMMGNPVVTGEHITPLYTSQLGLSRIFNGQQVASPQNNNVVQSTGTPANVGLDQVSDVTRKPLSAAGGSVLEQILNPLKADPSQFLYNGQDDYQTMLPQALMSRRRNTLGF
jgi:hypothetical protein